MKKLFFIALISLLTISSKAAISGEGVDTNVFLWIPSVGKFYIKDGATLSNILVRGGITVSNNGNASYIIQAPASGGSGILDYWMGATNEFQIINPSSNPRILEFRDKKNLSTPFAITNTGIFVGSGFYFDGTVARSDPGGNQLFRVGPSSFNAAIQLAIGQSGDGPSSPDVFLTRTAAGALLVGTNLTTRGTIYAGEGVDITTGQLILRGGAGSGAIWNGLGGIKWPSDGVVKFFNDAQNDFSRIQFGGTSSSFPAFKRSSTNLLVRLADDSAYGGLDTGSLRVSSPPIPATAGANGTAGDIAWDSGFIYVCVSANTWKRIAIATW